MNKFRITISTFAVLIFAISFVSVAQAQATRTWVSGLGNDADPCSRTAPCKTFAGAISKTTINGEIDVLDPGGYGAVTITKSITIDGTYGAGFGSILPGTTTAININMTDVSGNDPLHQVRLRNLALTGTGLSATVGTRVGLNGIRILSTNAAGSNVYIENCLISDFSQRGISDERANGGTLQITDTTVRNNTQTGIGIVSGVNATLSHLRVENNGGSSFAGISIDNGASPKVSIENSQISGNGIGINVHGNASVNVESCFVVHNHTGLSVDNSAGGCTLRISNCNVFGNTTGVFNPGGIASLRTYGNNHLDVNITAAMTNPQ